MAEQAQSKMEEDESVRVFVCFLSLLILSRLSFTFFRVSGSSFFLFFASSFLQSSIVAPVDRGGSGYEIDADGVELFCICRSVYDPRQFMIG